MPKSTISQGRVQKYLRMANEALNKVSESYDGEQGRDLYELAASYVEDAEHWVSEDELVLAYGALNFAHGLLDAGVRTSLFDVHDPSLFTQESR
jgi:hypothetical protein